MKFGKANFQGQISGEDYNRLVTNIALNSFRIAVGDAITLQKMQDGIVDEFEDENGVDLVNSINILYDGTDDYYYMGEGDTTTLDYMEYATDGDAQTAYVSSVSADLQVYSENAVIEQGTYSLKAIADITDSLNDWIIRVVSPTIDLSNRDTVKFKIRSNRTGSNLKIKIKQDDTYTKTLLHFNGADTEKFTKDDSPSNHVITFYGDAQIDTAQSKFGGSSLYFNGTTDYVTISSGTDLNLSGVDFTIDFWIRYYGSVPGDSTPVSRSFETGWLFQYYGSGFQFYSNNNSQSVLFDALSANTWYHVALVYVDGVAKAYLNGTLKNQTTMPVTNGSGVVYLGRLDTYEVYFNGWIDEFRISKGIARWTENFTPETEEYSLFIVDNTITVNSANIWETKAVDIDTIANADKNRICSIEFNIINADAENTFYIDEVYTYAEANGYTLISNSTEAESEPTEGRIVILEEDINTVTINTDLMAYISLDNGVNWDLVTLEDKGDFATGIRVLTGNVILTDRSDKTMKWKIVTDNKKNCKIHGTGLFWR